MLWKKAQPKKTTDRPEVCINLWYFMDETSGVIYRTSGRAYALCGTDEEKLAALNLLAATDFHVAQVFKIPPNFKVTTPDGELVGATLPQAIRESHAAMFEPVFKGLDKDLPHQMHSRNGSPEKYKLNISENPLCVTTCVLEDEQGNLTPLISKTV
jgi:hypothetical protein